MSKKSILIILIIILVLFIRLHSHRRAFIRPFNVKTRSNIKKDWQLYPYAGMHYLKTGDLSKLNIEHPPLGKYLLGISVLYFNNENIILMPFSFLLLLFIYLTANKILKNDFLSLLAVILFSSEYLFLNRSTYAYLDLFHAFFIILFIYTSFLKNKKTLHYILLGLSLGAVASTKYPVTALILAFSFLVLHIFNNKSKKLRSLLIVFTFAFLVLSFSYTPLLLRQGTGGFLKLQEKALRIHLSHLPEYPSLIPLKVMFKNEWPIWWNEQNPILKTIEWSIFWPILAGAILLSPIFYFLDYLKNKKLTSLLFFIFSWAYFIFINTRLFFPGYLFLLLPNLYIILFWEIQLTAKFIKNVIIKR